MHIHTARNTSLNLAGVEPVHRKPADIDSGSLFVIRIQKHTQGWGVVYTDIRHTTCQQHSRCNTLDAPTFKIPHVYVYTNIQRTTCQQHSTYNIINTNIQHTTCICIQHHKHQHSRYNMYMYIPTFTIQLSTTCQHTLCRIHQHVNIQNVNNISHSTFNMQHVYVYTNIHLHLYTNVQHTTS